MILIAESGSTKTQWCIVDQHTVEDLHNTPGINPYILSITEIETIMRPVSVVNEQYKLDAIYYFGAGCSTVNNIEKIQIAISHIFKCKNINIDTDLKAACLALAADKKGMIGLLGTGSNSCIWDGSQIIHQRPSLGYILGDDGGGVSIGKQLITDYLTMQMPENISKKFANSFNISAKQVLERVYQSPMPNRFLAGFAPFAEENISDMYCRNIVAQQFKRFFIKNISLYPDADKYELSFCGSIAYSHADILKETAHNFGLMISKIEKEPIKGLAHYFQKHPELE
jgi:N-acetylglucosamine kinase-like BadF-type ATPase